MSKTSEKRHIHLFTVEPPKKESDWENVEKDLEAALRKNVQRVQQKAGTTEGRRESVYIGDIGVALMEITLADHRRRNTSTSDRHRADTTEESSGGQDILSPTFLISMADYHLASPFYDGPLSKPTNIRDGGHVSFLETPLGLSTLILSRYPIGKQTLFAKSQWVKCREYLQAAAEIIDREDMDFPEEDDGCEVLYGRAGFLYALLFLRSALVREKQRREQTSEPQARNEDLDGKARAAKEDLESLNGLLSDATLGKIIKSIIRRGRNGAEKYRSDFAGSRMPPLMWTWHHKRYLGGAHGVAGILQMLLRCPPALTAEHMSEIVHTIDWLVHCQDHKGNWPSGAPDAKRGLSGDHELVQWCHGAPAMLILLSTILRMSVIPGTRAELTEKQQKEFVVSLQRGCALVYMHGLLRKGVGLCHGVAGSVYALLAASDVLDDPRITAVSNPQPSSSSPESSSATTPTGQYPPYFIQAAHLAHLATYTGSLTRKGEMRTPDHPWSLYEGMAGMCCAWEEILFRMRHRGSVIVSSGMPGYDDLITEG